MATTMVRSDDMSGDALSDSTPTTTITISDPRWEHGTREIDLSDTSFKALQKALEKFVAKSRPVTPPTHTGAFTDAEEGKAARAWAIATGLQPPVSGMGQVPVRAIVAYRAYLDNRETEQSARSDAVIGK